MVLITELMQREKGMGIRSMLSGIFKALKDDGSPKGWYVSTEEHQRPIFDLDTTIVPGDQSAHEKSDQVKHSPGPPKPGGPG
jgi:hypothetical protein